MLHLHLQGIPLQLTALGLLKCLRRRCLALLPEAPIYRCEDPNEQQTTGNGWTDGMTTCSCVTV